MPSKQLSNQRLLANIQWETEDLKSFLKHPWGEDWWLFYLNKYECDLFSFSVFRPDIKGYGLWCGLFSMKSNVEENLSRKNWTALEILLHFQIQKFPPDSLSKYTHYANHWMVYVYPYFTNYNNLSHSISNLAWVKTIKINSYLLTVCYYI